MLRLRRQVYLDNNATTSVSKAVRKKIQSVLKNCYGNPSSIYRIARNSSAVLEESRIQIAKTIGSKPEEIIFTGSASEANNQILKSLTHKFYPKKTAIISTPIEHPSVIETLKFLKDKGVNVLFCPVDRDGRVIIEKLANMISVDTFLICCMFANNETGVIQDLPKIVEIAKGYGILVMSDCVQALGKISVDVKKFGVDYATFSAHKIHGPKGVGALYVKEGSPIFSFVHGGHQENGLRAGTESIHNIAGFAEACKNTEKMLEGVPAILSLKNILINEIKKIMPSIRINSPVENCLPNTINITFPGFDNAAFIGFLDYYGIGVSAGSACNTQVNEPSHVLKAINLTDDEARQTLRISLSSEITLSDIKYTVNIMRDYLEKRASSVTMFSPAQVDENMLFNENLFVLDIRYGYDRKILKGLPNSHEASFVFLKRYLHAIPRNKNIVTVCQAGFDGPIAAYYLKSKGYKNVGFIVGGVAGWKIFHPDLFEKFGGYNVTQLKEERIAS